jgi:PhnB protein
MGEARVEGPMVKAKHSTPDGYRSVTHAFVVDDAARAIEFYVRALGAKERNRSLGPGGKVWHAELELGDSVVMLSDEFAGGHLSSPKKLGGTSASVWLYVPDVDAAFQRAVKAGATAVQEPMTMFWGDRFATVVDPFGHAWSIATHVEDLTPDERTKRQAEALKQSGPG